MANAQLAAQLVSRLRLKQLALLTALVDQRTLHRAAEQVHLSQPSATKMVHDLEELFGFPLFERLPRGMQPTELGSVVAAFAARMLADIERFAQDVESKRKGGYGELVVGAIMGAAPDVVARAVADIKAHRPLLKVSVLGETSDEIVSFLLRRKIDLAVGRFNGLLQHNEIDYEVLGNETLYVVARKGHALAPLRRIELTSLADAPWILQPLSSPARQIMEQEFGQAGMVTPADVVECSSIFATLQLLQKSNAVAVLPESVVRDYLQAGLLVRLRISVGKSLPGFGILTRRGEPLGATAIEFIQSLRRYGALMEQRPGERPVRGAAPPADPAANVAPDAAAYGLASSLADEQA